MGKSMADVLREEGRKIGELRALRRILLELLEVKFGKLPEEIRAAIKATASVEQLRHWLKRIISANSLEEMQIGSSS